MEAEDQRYRQPAHVDQKASDIINVEHVRRLKRILDEYGWPTISMVGEDGADAAWLIAQHADREPVFQKRVLEMMYPLLSVDEVTPETYAYLYDRIHVPQRYGTQGECHGVGDWRPREIENLQGVDKRRHEMGMSTLQEYIDTVSAYLCIEQIEH